MLVIVITALSIVLISLAQDNFYLTDNKDTFKNDNDNNILKEILQRIDKLQSQMDQMESKNNIRFDQLDAKIEADNKNLAVIMETIVEQQMVITAEIFTVSQALPSCCNTDPPELKTSTTESGKPETTTPTTLKSLPTYCAESMGESGINGIYQINVTDSNIGPFDVYCMKNAVDNEKEKDINGTWMIIQRRQENSTNFYQNWTMYQLGFGELTKSFWIGLDKLYALTKSTEQELWVQLESSTGLTGWEKYSHFSIGSESEKYALKTVGFHNGTAGDSLSPHVGVKWSTYDRDNDKVKFINCAKDYKGAWWFHYCRNSHLNGVTDIMWHSFPGSNSLIYAHMAIRPRK